MDLGTDDPILSVGRPWGRPWQQKGMLHVRSRYARSAYWLGRGWLGFIGRRARPPRPECSERHDSLV